MTHALRNFIRRKFNLKPSNKYSKDPMNLYLENKSKLNQKDIETLNSMVSPEIELMMIEAEESSLNQRKGFFQSYWVNDNEITDDLDKVEIDPKTFKTLEYLRSINYKENIEKKDFFPYYFVLYLKITICTFIFRVLYENYSERFLQPETRTIYHMRKSMKDNFYIVERNLDLMYGDIIEEINRMK